MQKYNDVSFFLFFLIATIKKTCPKSTHEEKIYFIQEVTVHHWQKSSEEPWQDRNMEQKPSTNTANWLTLWLRYPAQDLLFGDGTTHSELAPPLLTNH